MDKKINLKTEKTMHWVIDDCREIKSVKQAMMNILCSYNIAIKCFHLGLNKFNTGKPKYKYEYQEETDYRHEELTLKDNYYSYYGEFYKDKSYSGEHKYPAFTIYEFVYHFLPDHFTNKEFIYKIFKSPIDTHRFVVKVDERVYLRDNENNNEFEDNKNGYILAALSILNYYNNKI